MKQVGIPSSFIKQDIEVQGITEEELDELFNFTDSYEDLFSRKAKLYQQRNLNDKQLLEKDYQNLILEHYTFLKRPIIVNNDKIFIGSSAKTVTAAIESINPK